MIFLVSLFCPLNELAPALGWNIYTKHVIATKSDYMKTWRYERSSRLIRNLSNCEREAWKKLFRLQRDSNPWPLRYRCSALPTELWSHNCWEQVNFSGSIMPLRVIQHYSDWVCTAVMSNDVMTLWKIFAVDTQFKQLRKRSLKKIQASAGFEPVTSAIPVQCSTNWAMKP